jgi:hypothetical protein
MEHGGPVRGSLERVAPRDRRRRLRYYWRGSDTDSEGSVMKELDDFVEQSGPRACGSIVCRFR